LEDNFADSIMHLRYSWDKGNGEKETWEDISKRVVDNVLSIVDLNKDTKDEIYQIIADRKFIPGGRFLAQSGKLYHQVNNCFCLKAEDSREGWGDLAKKSVLALMSGGGIGIDYSNLRPTGSALKRTGGTSSGVLPAVKIINEIGRGVMSGGKRRSAIWAGLQWDHADIDEFIKLKNWIPEVIALKEKNFDFPASGDMTNISVILDKPFFDAYDNINNPMHQKAQEIYWNVIHRMLKTGEPGFSVNFKDSLESLRNACTEIVSDRDSDVCCLGSINLPRIASIEELKKVTELGIIFLLAGTEYSDVPYTSIRQVREDYRRLGLGLMGIHEWLILHNHQYEENEELTNWLDTWKRTSNSSAKFWSSKFNMNEPIAKRAIAPNGSISIAGGMTTSGIEPIFSRAFQRRYLTPDGWKKQYVVDFVAERLYNQGINIDNLEDAYTLSLDVEKRIKFQSYVQKYVDNSISSTINIPRYKKQGNDNEKQFGEILYNYLPHIRGITVYPDGARGGQPLTAVDFKYALERKGVVFEGHEECEGGVCGL
jgi:ribonucleoside-diphosphate reductase alpha chain